MLSEIIILGFAVYGVSILLTSSDGVYGIFLRLRNKFPNSALQCVKCTAVWVSVPMFIVMLLGYGLWLTPLAIIGVVILMEEATTC